MGQGSSAPTTPETSNTTTTNNNNNNNNNNPTGKKLGLKSGKPICCCCPDTKKLRDECIVQLGEEHPECQVFIESHKECLRAEGFTVA